MKLIPVCLLLAGCATYVPVEVQVAKPVAPPECGVAITRLAPMPLLPTDAAERVRVCEGKSLAVCISERWAKRDLAWQGVVRRAEARRRICQVYVEKVSG